MAKKEGNKKRGWMMQGGRSFFPTLLALIVLGLTACGPDEGQWIAEGQTVYIENCSRCHQFDGQGFVPVYPDLAGNPIVVLHDPNPTIDIVLNGRGGMLAFRDRLDVEELAQVISYIRNAWGNNASTVSRTQMR